MAELISEASTELAREIEALRAELAEAQEVIRAIQSGDVDAVVVSGKDGQQIFTLKGAEYAYRALVEAMNEGAATLGADGMVLYCNQRLADLFGIPLEQIIGRPLAQLIGDEARHTLEDLFAHALSGEAAQTELELRPAEDRSIPVYLSLREMKGDEPTALCMVVTDLTENKKWNERLAAEATLRKQAELLKLSFDAILVWRPESGIESWNVGAEQLYRYSESEALGRAPRELLGSIFPKPWPEIEAELHEKGLWQGEIRQHTRDGREIIVSARKQMVRDADGHTCVLETNRDITERKRAEEALRESEKAFITLANEVPQFVWMCSADGSNLYFNQRWVDYTGLTLEQSYGTGWNTPFHPDDKEAAWDAWNHAVQIREEYRVESRLRASDGSYRWFLMQGRPLISTTGAVEQWFGTCTDIHELKRAQQALIQSEKLASVGRMASTIAHEINNPLETIGNAIYLASTDPGSSPKTKSYLEMAAEALDRAAHVTRQTLAFHRENKQPTLIDLRENIDGLLTLFAPRLKTRGIALEKRYAEVEPILATGAEVQQIVSNLLSNSLDAMPNTGKIQLRISRSIGRNETQGVRLTIADTGSGIPPEKLPKIFEPFFTTKEVVGTGLGLWVSKQIADKHGATIRVRSKPGRGTAFSIVFPIARRQHAAKGSDGGC